MSGVIRIRPTAERRRDFARWSVAQTPKIRTVSESDFAVPADLFTEMPERLLIGSLVDGRQYISPEEEHQETPGSGAQGPTADRPPTEPEEVRQRAKDPPTRDLLGVAIPEGFTTPERPLQGARFGALPLPAEAPYADGATPTAPVPGDKDQAPSSDPGPEKESAPYRCDQCSRQFTTAQGRSSHRRQIHARKPAADTNRLQEG